MDTMYYHQALHAEDWPQFKQAMHQEVQDHIKNKRFTLINREEIPTGTPILSEIWAMRWKRCIVTGQIYKRKAIMNIDGSNKQNDIHYDTSYSPVATWDSIRIIMSLTIKHMWHTVHIDFVQAFTQDPSERDLYMRIPPGFSIKGKLKQQLQRYALKIHKNI